MLYTWYRGCVCVRVLGDRYIYIYICISWEWEEKEKVKFESNRM